MKNWNYYHGTTELSYESIKKYGFLVGDVKYNKYLAPQGIYFVCNRPLIARRFACIAHLSDGSPPIVLNVKLKIPHSEHILDLTKDDGLYDLYMTHKKIRQLLASPRLGTHDPHEYNRTLSEKDKKFMEKINAFQSYSKKNRRTANWDSVAIELLVSMLNIKIVVAAFQEGMTFIKAFSGKEPKYKKSRHFGGIRARDHIEVCVTDPSIIDRKRLSIRDISLDNRDFHDDSLGYISFITNIHGDD